ncbi:ABC transporter permease [Pseudomonas sp. UBA7530]|jgi:peptide/nickel transport system permease protein|uniref:ABC transporter permease n=1 Tax=Pseudomonas sp. UBA7530 TaxID=1947341 RepID=UPI0025EAD837|nr:ABC transporter permease [Pseudomonas sp. UBA7530]
MKGLVRFLGHRLLFVVPQLFGILLIAFLLVKNIPGDPAVLMLGPNATDASVTALRTQLGLDQSLAQQFWLFIVNLTQGNLGTSWQTTRPVLDDLIQRFPATLELVSLGLLAAILIGVPLGVAAALKSGFLSRVADIYGLIVGGLPDFWLGLVMIFVFYTLLQWAPPPFGRLDMIVLPPPTVTGLLTVDSVLAGDWAALGSAIRHLLLPVLTLGLVSAGPILKMTQSMVEQMLSSDFSRYEVISGLPRRYVTWHALRNAAPAVVTIISVLYGYLLGGAVLVETVFSWGGAGQYAVQGVLNSDIFPVLGFVLFASVFSLIVYLLVDITNFVLDPRVGR